MGLEMYGSDARNEATVQGIFDGTKAARRTNRFKKETVRQELLLDWIHDELNPNGFTFADLEQSCNQLSEGTIMTVDVVKRQNVTEEELRDLVALGELDYNEETKTYRVIDRLEMPIEWQDDDED